MNIKVNTIKNNCKLQLNQTIKKIFLANKNNFN